MRTDCRHYESRTYPSGDVVRKCRLDLAPDAPWRCPEDCPSYSRRTIDAGWQYGSFGPAPEPVEPPAELGEDAARLLDEAEQIVNLAGLELLEERSRSARKGFFRKRKRR
jgi:hypothetical protein